MNESFCFFFQKEARSFLKKRTKKLLSIIRQNDRHSTLARCLEESRESLGTPLGLATGTPSPCCSRASLLVRSRRGHSPSRRRREMTLALSPGVCPDRSVAAAVVVVVWRWWRRRIGAKIGRWRRCIEVGVPRMRAMPVPVRTPSVMPPMVPSAVPTIPLPLSAVGIAPALGLGGRGMKGRCRREGDQRRTHQSAAYASHRSILRPRRPQGLRPRCHSQCLPEPWRRSGGKKTEHGMSMTRPAAPAGWWSPLSIAE